MWNMYSHELTALNEPITFALSDLTSVNGNLTLSCIDEYLCQKYWFIVMKGVLRCFCVVNCNITVIGGIIEKIKVWLTVDCTSTSSATN